MLNAFRHQRTNDIDFSLRPAAASLCSTPFGINERTTVRQVLEHVPQRNPCSTPFGINERTTPATTVTGSAKSSCSTPFGINERTTQRPQVAEVQRDLCSTPFGINERTTGTASKILWWSYRCSTPFGINERTTENARLNELRWEVLNAFRHQRTNDDRLFSAGHQSVLCSTPFGINERTTVTPSRICEGHWRAQRLSASTNERPGVPCGSQPTLLGAQRLSASTNERPPGRCLMFGWA